MARSFNGTTDWYQTVSRVNPQSALTYSCWAKPTVVNVAQILFCSNQFGAGQLVYSQFFVNGSAGINGRVEQNGVGNAFIGRTTANSIVSAGAWAHFAFTWNGGTTPAAIKVYLNGTQVDNANDTNGVFTAVSASSIPMYIGAQNNGTIASPVWQSGFTGSIADVAVWSIALTASEITALSVGARPESIRPLSLFAWIPLDGLVTVEPDLSGNVDNATVVTGGPALAFGPPIMLFTPRWPQIIVPPAVGGLFLPTEPLTGMRVGGPFFGNPIG